MVVTIPNINSKWDWPLLRNWSEFHRSLSSSCWVNICADCPLLITAVWAGGLASYEQIHSLGLHCCLAFRWLQPRRGIGQRWGRKRRERMAYFLTWQWLYPSMATSVARQPSLLLGSLNPIRSSWASVLGVQLLTALAGLYYLNILCWFF